MSIRLNEDCQNLGKEDCVDGEVADLNILRTRPNEECQNSSTENYVEVEMADLKIWYVGE
jgi:hypothetical protein